MSWSRIIYSRKTAPWLAGALILVSACGKDKTNSAPPPPGANGPASAAVVPAAPVTPPTPAPTPHAQTMPPKVNLPSPALAHDLLYSGRASQLHKGIPVSKNLPGFVSFKRGNDEFDALPVTLDPSVITQIKGDDQNFDPTQNYVQLVIPLISLEHQEGPNPLGPGQIEFLPLQTDKPVAELPAFTLYYEKKTVEVTPENGAKFYHLIYKHPNLGNLIVGEIKLSEVFNLDATGAAASIPTAFQAVITKLVPKPADPKAKPEASLVLQADKFQDISIDDAVVSARLAAEAEAKKPADLKAKAALNELQQLVTDKIKSIQDLLDKTTSDRLEKEAVNSTLNSKIKELSTLNDQLKLEAAKVPALQSKVAEGDAAVKDVKAKLDQFQKAAGQTSENLGKVSKDLEAKPLEVKPGEPAPVNVKPEVAPPGQPAAPPQPSVDQRPGEKLKDTASKATEKVEGALEKAGAALKKVTDKLAKPSDTPVPAAGGQPKPPESTPDENKNPASPEVKKP